jgi:hypothetical protein
MNSRKRRRKPVTTWLSRWRGRASKWHPGLPHNEVVCSFEEWLACQPLRRRRHFVTSRGRL